MKKSNAIVIAVLKLISLINNSESILTITLNLIGLAKQVLIYCCKFE